MTELLKKGCQLLGMEISNELAENFITFSDMLVTTNESVNLTAITEPEEIVTKHFLDSITAARLIPENASVIDVGCGAGFPGLPIKFVRDDISLTLLDSLAKRLSFIDRVISEFSLKNTRTVHARAEDGGRDKLHREKYDVALSRAVANMSTLCEYCLPYVKVGGTFLALKGPAAKEELEAAEKAINVLGGKIKEIANVEIPFTDLSHKIVVVEKISSCPDIYPRKAGTPSKKPIGGKKI